MEQNNSLITHTNALQKDVETHRRIFNNWVGEMIRGSQQLAGTHIFEIHKDRKGNPSLVLVNVNTGSGMRREMFCCELIDDGIDPHVIKLEHNVFNAAEKYKAQHDIGDLDFITDLLARLLLTLNNVS